MAMVKKGVFGSASVLLACLLACVILTSLRLVITGKSRTRSVDTYDLVVDASVFPEQWEVCIGPTHPPERVGHEHGEIEFIFVGFCAEGFDQGIGAAEHDVFKYGDELGAHIAFRWDFSRHQFSNRYTVSSWAEPQQWSYRSPVAHRFKFACAEVEPFGADRAVLSCRALAQYDEYISVFGGNMSHMTLEDMERILVAIDERMAFYLEKDAE